MKKVALLVTIVGFLAVGNSSFAQDGQPRKGEHAEKSPVEKAEKMTTKMTEDLKLSEDQAVEVRKLNTYHIQEMEEIKRQMKALKAEAREKRKAHEAKIDEVLTEEQKKLRAEKLAERKSNREKKKKDCDHHRP